MDSRWSGFVRALLLSGVFLGGCESGAPERPDLVLITLDTFRWDRTGFSGNPHGLTPEIDALAADSVVFEHAVTTMATTFPAHASMLTGLSPRRHGVRWNGDSLSQAFTTVPEILGHYGYETAAFVAYKTMITRGGLGQGFGTRSDRSAPASHWDMRSDAEVTRLAIEWLEGRAGRPEPFFLWVHYFGAHSPYSVTEYARRRMAGYEGFLADGTDARELLAHRDLLLSSEAERSALAALYDGSVVEVDRQVGVLLEALRSSDEARTMIVALTSDHGQALGDGALGHGGLLVEAAVRVPLLISHPAGCRGCRVRERVGVGDLAPTLLDLADVLAPQGLDGRSLAPAVFGQALEARPYVVETKHEPRHGSLDEDAARRAVYVGGLKLVRGPQGTRLFDVSDGGGTPLPPISHEDSPEVRLGLETLDRYADGKMGEASRRVEELSPETIEELRALGYVE